MTTTIQISENLRDDLLKFKTNSKISYEDIIKKALEAYKKEGMAQNKSLEEEYRELAKLSLEITQDWESMDLEELSKIEY